jgi:hypothetical protein
MPVPNTFANATATIPLSQLDANFATTITLGNTAIQLGNTVSTLNNMTLANVTVTSGNVTLTNVTVTTANVTTANIGTQIVTTSQTLNYGTANGVVYLNGSKVSTTGTALTYDGTTFTSGAHTVSTGVLTVPAGSNTAPSITFSGDTNTGIFSPAADTIAFAEGGTEVARLDSSGNFGIGTSSPNQRLQVNNPAAASSLALFTNATTGSTNADGSFYGVDSSGNAYVWNQENLPILFGTNNGERMRIDNAGNVGIGTSSPASTLNVANASGGNVAGANPSNEAVRITQSPTVGSGGYVLQRLFLNKSSTANDGAALSFEGLAVGGDRYALGNIGGYIDNAGSGNSVSGYLAFLTKPTNASITERARISSAGNLLVGTTSDLANARLTVINTAASARLMQMTKGDTNDYFIVADSLGSNRFLVSGTGAVLALGVYSTVVGATNRDVFVDSTGNLGYVSSLRETKTNIANLTDTSWLYQLNPVTFNYRKKDEEGNYTDDTDGDIQYGMIAEDVEQVRPDLCFYDEVNGQQELRGIQYSKLVPVMLKALQEQQQMIETLQAKVAALEGKK